jgi:hypothetical protein
MCVACTSSPHTTGVPRARTRYIPCAPFKLFSPKSCGRQKWSAPRTESGVAPVSAPSPVSLCEENRRRRFPAPVLVPSRGVGADWPLRRAGP